MRPNPGHCIERSWIKSMLWITIRATLSTCLPSLRTPSKEQLCQFSIRCLRETKQKKNSDKELEKAKTTLHIRSKIWKETRLNSTQIIRWYSSRTFKCVSRGMATILKTTWWKTARTFLIKSWGNKKCSSLNGKTLLGWRRKSTASNISASSKVKSNIN